MIVHRTIAGINVDIETTSGNEVYLPDNVADLIQEPDLNGIFRAIFDASNEPYLPLNLFIECTSLCNFQCPWCYVNEPGCKKMSVPRFNAGLKDILDCLIERGLLHITISGGEPLVHPDFIQTYRYLKECGVLVTVFSNASLLQKHHFQLFTEYPPFKFEVSIYGITDESLRRAVGIDNVNANHIFNNILYLKDVIGVNVVAKTPITSLTEESYLRIQEWCASNDIPYYTGSELISTYSGESRNSYLASQELRDHLKNKADETFFASPERMASATTEHPQQKKAFECSAGRHDLFLSGNMLMPCMAAQWTDWKFNITEYGGAEAAYEAMVSRILVEKGKPIAGCRGCKHSPICHQCIMTIGQFDSGYCKDLALFMRGGCSNGK